MGFRGRACQGCLIIGAGVAALHTRFYIDPETDDLHILSHGVEEREVADVLESPDEDRSGRDGVRIAIGRTRAGRCLRVIYVPDPEPDYVFVITAYEISGNPLAAFRRRMRRRGQ